MDATRYLEGLHGPLTFGDFINSIRLGEEWTLKQMSEKLGVSVQHLCDIEKGRRSIGAARAARWACELGYDDEQMVRLALQAELEREGVPMTVEVRRITRRPKAAAHQARSARRNPTGRGID